MGKATRWPRGLQPCHFQQMGSESDRTFYFPVSNIMNNGAKTTMMAGKRNITYNGICYFGITIRELIPYFNIKLYASISHSKRLKFIHMHSSHRPWVMISQQPRPRFLFHTMIIRTPNKSERIHKRTHRTLWLLDSLQQQWEYDCVGGLCIC